MSTELADNEVYCRDCGKPINKKAEICPECGVRQKEPPQPTQQNKEKDPGLAAVGSFIIPGVGQVYNGEIAKGIVLGIIFFALAITGVGLVLAIPLWIFLVYDAYKTADSSESGTENMEIVEIDSEIEKVIADALHWYEENEPNAETTAQTRKKFERTGFEDMSETDLETTLNAVNFFANAQGDADFSKTRNAVQEQLRRAR